MVDLIDRSALLEKIDKKFFATCPEGDEQLGYLNSRNLIRTSPAVDAVEVVRCKDCKSWTRHSGVASYSPTGLCSTWADTTLGVDFCSYGERRTDA